MGKEEVLGEGDKQEVDGRTSGTSTYELKAQTQVAGE